MSGDRLRATLGAPELDWIWQRVRRRLETGGDARWGTVRLAGATPAQRAAVDRLLGRRPTRGDGLAVHLAELDRLVRDAELADGLGAAVEALTGPVVDRRAERERRARRWERVLDDARGQVVGRPALVTWLADLSAAGMLRRLAGGDPDSAARLLADAIAVVARLPAPAVPLAELAAQTTGDSHALDAGRPLATLAVRAAARIGGVEPPDDAAGRRDAWAAAGVLVDELSAPVLVLNIPADPGSVSGQVLGAHADAGEPARLPARLLLRHPPAFPAALRRVFVCENPTVVARAADRLAADAAPLVCVEGQPATAARLLLGALAGAGVALAYHGDFDWGGVRIANLVMRRHGAAPWRFTAADYQATSGGTALTGRPVDAEWDPALAPAMVAAGRAVHEETVLDDLLSDLAGQDPGSGRHQPDGPAAGRADAGRADAARC